MELIIAMCPEIILSLVVLILVLYGINLSIVKVAIGALFVVGVVTNRVFYADDYLIWGTDGLLLTNS